MRIASDDPATCWDCYVSNQVGYGPCHKHSTPEQRAEFDRHITEIANQEHPVFAMLKKKAT